MDDITSLMKAGISEGPVLKFLDLLWIRALLLSASATIIPIRIPDASDLRIISLSNSENTRNWFSVVWPVVETRV